MFMINKIVTKKCYKDTKGNIHLLPENAKETKLLTVLDPVTGLTKNVTNDQLVGDNKAKMCIKKGNKTITYFTNVHTSDGVTFKYVTKDGKEFTKFVKNSELFTQKIGYDKDNNAICVINA